MTIAQSNRSAGFVKEAAGSKPRAAVSGPLKPKETPTKTTSEFKGRDANSEHGAARRKERPQVFIRARRELEFEYSEELSEQLGIIRDRASMNGPDSPK